MFNTGPVEKQDFIKVLRALGRTVVHYPIFSKVFGSNNCGVFLSQMLYWEGKQEDEDGWIRKPLLEIEQELGFSRYEMESIRKRLKECLVLEEKKMGMPAKLHYKFDWDRINDLVNQHLTKQKEEKQGPKEKQPTVVYSMKEYFLSKLEEYVPGSDYEWMGKDWENLKRLKGVFEKRIIQKKSKAQPDIPAHEATPEEVLEAFQKFIDMLPDFYRTQRYTPTLLYSDFNSIEAKIIQMSKQQTNVNSNNQNNNTVDFGAAARKAAGGLP